MTIDVKLDDSSAMKSQHPHSVSEDCDLDSFNAISIVVSADDMKAVLENMKYSVIYRFKKVIDCSILLTLQLFNQ